MTLSLAAAQAQAQAPAPAPAQRVVELEAKVQAMAEELTRLREELDKPKQQNASPQTDVRAEALAASEAAQRAAASAAEWKNTAAVTHLAGYAAVGYTDQKDGTNAFDLVTFNPIFHFQYKDLILLESELEIELDEEGNSDLALEYMTVDVFLNDYLTFVGGKFLSPIGTFRENFHTAWINKLPSAPPGFGHDGAAPSADIGFQLRGGVPVGRQSRLTYTGFVGNGPRLAGEDGEVEGIDSEGFPSDEDGRKIWGGRLAFLPTPKFEVGVSSAVGKTAVAMNDGVGVIGDPVRDYRVVDMDLAYQWKNLGVRGEYVQQDVGDNAASLAPDGGKWEAWYLQGSYKFAKAKWEGVVRYGDFSTPHANDAQEQVALGINYLLTPSAIVKVAYEINDGLAGMPSDDNRWLVQFAYGY